ncbi:hypothetical protein ACOSP7_012872 [Xanthoceras sorbifolium]
MGFHSSKADHSLFCRFHKHHCTYLLVYVDDIIITGSDPTLITLLVSQLHKSFALKDLGALSYFLGIEVSSTSTGLHLSQQKYITDLLHRTGMLTARPFPSPMVASTGHSLSAYTGSPVSNSTEYRSVVGALQYATITRPDIAYSVNRVCQFMQYPLDEHWKAVKRILWYLQGTLTAGLHFTRLNSVSSLNLVAYSDADWASNPDDRKSTSGFCIFFGPNLVTWSAKKQHTISRSSTEAEYRSLASTVAELTWLKSLLQELRVPQPVIPTIWCDNLSTIAMASNPVLHARTKHIELDLYFVRDKVVQGAIQVNHVPTIDQLADIFTKALPTPRGSPLAKVCCQWGLNLALCHILTPQRHSDSTGATCLG